MGVTLLTLWQYRKALLYTLIAIALGAIAWRAWQYGEVKDQLGQAEKELAAERACEPATTCAQRALEAARVAEEQAAQKASDALAEASAREEAAQRDAAAWRAKYRSAIQNDPGCKAWSESPVACPL